MATTSEQSGGESTYTKRAIEREKKHSRFRYGELPEDHPLSRYVNQLASRLKEKRGLTFHIVIAPDWKELNAVSLPDGTIIISAELLRQAETEEALLGVIAHERVHAYQAHIDAVKRKTQDAEFTAKTTLETVSMLRSQEYEADLRGTLQDLQEASVSPLEYKALLEKLHHRETSGGGIIHGSSMDRALNIASVIHVVDLRALSTERSPIPKELLESFGAYGQYSRQHLLHRPRAFYSSQEELEERYKNRDRAIETLSPEEIPLAINAVYNYTELTHERKKINVKNVEALRRLIAKFDAELLPADIPEKDRPTARLICLQFFTQINPFGTTAIHKRLFGDTSDLIKTPEEALRVRTMIEKYLPSVPLQYLESLDYRLGGIVQYLYGQKSFRALSANEQLQLAQNLVEGWAKTGSSLSTTHGLTKPKSESEVCKDIFWTLRSQIPEERQAQLAHSLGLQAEAREEKQLAGETEMYQRGYALGASKTQKEVDSKYSAIEKKILALCRTQSLQTIGPLLDQIERGVLQGGMTERRHRNDGAIDNDLSDQQGVPRPEIAYVKLALTSLTAMEQIGTITAQERFLIMLNIIHRSVFFSHGMLKSEIHYLQTTDRDEEVGVLETASDELPLLKTASGATIDEVALACRYLSVPGFCDQQLNVAKKEGAPVAALPEPLSPLLCTYLTSWLASKPFDQILSQIDQLKQQGIDVETILRDHPALCGPLVLTMTEAMKQESLNRYPLPLLLRYSDWIANPFLRSAFQRQVVDAHWASMAFEQKMNLLFPLSGEEHISDLHVQERFLEHEVRTEADYRAVKDRIAKKIDRFMAEGNQQAGVATIVSALNFERHDPNRFLEALLTMGEGDGPIKEVVYEYMPFKDLQTADDIVRLIGCLDDFGKQLALRYLLTANWGALPSAEKRKEFLELLLTRWVKPHPEEKNINTVLQNIKTALEQMPEWQLLYFALQNALRDKIAVPPPPQKTVPWTKISAIQDLIQDAPEESDEDHWSLAELENMLGQVEWTTVPEEARSAPYQYLNGYRGFSEKKLREALEKDGIMPTQESKRLSPLGFVKEVASRVGSVGVRFLQLLPQFVKLPQGQEEGFSDVYDSIKGQSKLAAIALLEREWPTLWQEIDHIGDRIGGGAAVTVYQAVTKTGEKIVLKVRNPNIEYHLNETFRFASVVLDRLAQSHGGNYAASQAALEDIRAWIENDIAFNHFLENDAAFHSANDGATKEGFRYAILVPASRGPESKFFSIEQMIEGKNLTQWDDLVAEGHDMKQIVSLLMTNYIQQIADGRVHSDVHIGNFRITADNKIAILDRNFYLAINNEERELLFSLLTPHSSQQREALFANYLKIPVDNAPQKKSLRQIAEALAGQDWDTARSGLVDLKQSGVQVPLTFTLLIKNMNSLRLMASKAGFESLTEAFSYSPEKK